MKTNNWVVVFAFIASTLTAPCWAALTGLTQITSDTSGNPGTDTTVQHKTSVDPSQAVFGETIVTTYQDGEIADYNGAAKVGWATSLDGGRTWQHGYIPDTTSYYWVQVVAFDLKHHTWLIMMIAQDVNENPVAVQVSRSFDGLTWSAPTSVYGPVDGNVEFVDRPWINCDNHLVSPNFGNCYIAWLDGTATASTNDLAVSHDGGRSWGAPVLSPDQSLGSVGGIAIQADGHLFLIGCYGGATLPYLYSVESSDGGQTLRPAVYITAEQLAYPTEGGILRQDPFPSASVSSDGSISVVTYDCRFRANCATNDIVMTTSKDGINWSPIQRIPIDSLDSGVDHFVAGIAAPDFTNLFEGASPHDLAVNYYYAPNAATCVPPGCQLYAGFISSRDGGRTWSKPTQVFGPMNIATDLAATAFGQFVANDITTIYVEGQPQSVYSLARPPGANGVLHQYIYSAQFSVEDGY